MRRLLLRVDDESYLLSDTRWAQAVIRLARRHQQWLRAPRVGSAAATTRRGSSRHSHGTCSPAMTCRRSWTPRGRSMPTPDCDTALYQDWFLHIGRGENIRKAAGLPVPLTKMMAHHFLLAPDGCTIVQAIRWGQLCGIGATARRASGPRQPPRPGVHGAGGGAVLGHRVPVPRPAPDDRHAPDRPDHRLPAPPEVRPGRPGERRRDLCRAGPAAVGSEHEGPDAGVAGEPGERVAPRPAAGPRRRPQHDLAAEWRRGIRPGRGRAGQPAPVLHRRIARHGRIGAPKGPRCTTALRRTAGPASPVGPPSSHSRRITAPGPSGGRRSKWTCACGRSRRPAPSTTRRSSRRTLRSPECLGDDRATCDFAVRAGAAVVKRPRVGLRANGEYRAGTRG